MKIRSLTQEDWKIWKSFRLEALKNSPENFESSYEEELNWSDLDFQKALTDSDIFGMFVDNSLVSCAGFYSLNSVKTKHRGVIWGMYTRPEYRGQGIATALIQAIINYANSRVSQLHLTCVTSNLEAVTFYQKQGFMEGNVCNYIGKYELVHNNKIIHTEIEGLKVRIYEPHELTEIIKSCGFQVRTIKAFEAEAAPDENDEAIVYECRK